MTNKLTWTNEQRKLSDLVPWEENPRELMEAEARRLVDSIRKFGYSQPIEIDQANVIVDGHQRDAVMIMMDEYGADAMVDVRVAPFEFTRHQRQEYTALKHKGTLARWDWDKLANFDVPDLLTWGFDEAELGLAGLGNIIAPEDFPEYDESIETEHRCPKCGYEWSGSSQ